jgi:hypothetical protein
LPYNTLETQRLCRQVENGNFRVLPGGELVDALYRQLKEADTLVMEQDRLLRAGSRDGRLEPAVAIHSFTPSRIMPSEGNPTGATTSGTDSRTVPPAPLTGQRNLAAPRTEAFNPFMATGGIEAPPPIPFSDTNPDGTAKAALQPPPQPGKRGRKIKLK